jgi:RNA polymerase sigma factor (sigma-70 family)
MSEPYPEGHPFAEGSEYMEERRKMLARHERERHELADQERFVLAALAGLPGKQRQVMAWSMDGFSPGEIAQVLGEEPAAVRQNLRRARQNLKRQLGISGRDVR